MIVFYKHVLFRIIKKKKNIERGISRSDLISEMTHCRAEKAVVAEQRICPISKVRARTFRTFPPLHLIK